jgi:hypothetical protein
MSRGHVLLRIDSCSCLFVWAHYSVEYLLLLLVCLLHNVSLPFHGTEEDLSSNQNVFLTNS